MSSSYLFLLLIALGVAAYFVGRGRATQLRDSGQTLHSLPNFHGLFFALSTALPPCLLTVAWIIATPSVIDQRITANMPAEIQQLAPGDQSLAFSLVNRLVPVVGNLSAADLATLRSGGDAATALMTKLQLTLVEPPQAYVFDAALNKAHMLQTSGWLIAGLSIVVAVFGFVFAWLRQTAPFRARNRVETVVRYSLMVASSVAVLTTLGIVLSVLSESISFFRSVPVFSFLFGTVWDPRFSAAGATGTSGQFGLLPLLWGTFFITIVALLVAIPIGLISAIYMSEYATPRVRAFAKPALEILAGIPTIVYGFFALSTFGPLLNRMGSNVGLDISPNSVLCAGFVMGVMIIPFVSSLSDDILSAVPNSLREGSYGLGATQSETIKKVILPAALPGIVGASLLAVSRAVGETMIVVLAAGIAANLTANPFKPVTTMTVKIVSQLTGDLEFNSPQTLVAFALGLTLFIFTLGLNVIALSIVRKYREQYE
jgi:phosphate transport system permease protein